MKCTPLNKVSKKRQATNAKRREFVREQISADPDVDVDHTRTMRQVVIR